MGGSGDPIEGEKFLQPEKPPLLRRKSEVSTKWAKEAPQEVPDCLSVLGLEGDVAGEGVG